jgi:ABC-type phosphate/phosphonate transport system substrate-binding protein
MEGGESMSGTTISRGWKPFFLLAGALAALAGAAALVEGESSSDTLTIGVSGDLTLKPPTTSKSADKTLKSFIKEQTGMDSVITTEKGWRDLVDKLENKKEQLGVFQGYEFAWAQEKFKNLVPLSIAVNIYRYTTVYVIVNRDNKAATFADLKGQSLEYAGDEQPCVKLFVDRQCQDAGSKAGRFFSKITYKENIEVVLDDVVDGVVQVTVADRAGLEAYKRRKPGRFKQLKEVARSQPFPPAIIAYRRNAVAENLLKRFRRGLEGAREHETGKMMLTLFHLTGFEDPPKDLDKVLARTRKAYPPEK